MNETIEDQLRRVLAQTAKTEVPDDTEVPPLRPVDQLAANRSRRHWLAPLISGVAAAVIAVVATLIAVNHSNGPAVAVSPAPLTASTSAGSAVPPAALEVAVPDLKTLSPGGAGVQLKARHLVMKTVRVISSDAAKDTVVGQTPAPGVTVKSGSTVTVRVGNGPTFTKVPSDLVGLRYDEAVAALKAANPTVTVTRQVVDGVPPLGTVVKVVGVEPGASVQDSTPVILQISNNELLLVPNLAGLRPTQAVARLNAAGWVGNASSLRRYDAQTTDSTLIGKIAGGTQKALDPLSARLTTKPGQNPAAGTKVRKSTQFTVVVYAKKQVTLPGFTAGVTTTDAVVAGLQHAGVFDIRVITQQPAVPPAVPHTFISMEPGIGGVVDFDTQVTVTVWGDATAPPTTNPLRTTTTK